MDALDTLRQRGFIQQSTPGLAERLARGPVTFYCGFDPTAGSLHVGHLQQVMAMAHLQRAGHRAIALIGVGTAMVGDPTGREEMRQLLDPARIAEHAGAYRRQLGAFLELDGEQGLVVENDWLLSLNYIAFLREVGAHVPMGQMLGRTSVRQRLERGMTFLEFNYQLLQAYDFLTLYRREGCVLQLGGDDQWGNITAGIDLVRRLERAEVHGLTTPLITTASGQKMGKTAGNAVWLDPERTTPYDFFQYWVNVDDADVGRFLRRFTFLPLERVAELEALQGADIREAKRVLALEVTALVHGKVEAQRALEGARAAFEGGSALGAMPNHPVTLPVPVVDALVDSGLCSSRSEARRMIRGGGVRVNGRRVEQVDAVLTAADLDDRGGILLSRGRKRRVRLVPAS